MELFQVSVFVENQSGRLADITEVLSANNVNIRALSLADTADFGVLRLIVDDPEATERILADNDFTVKLTKVLGVRVPDTPGGLSSVLRLLSERGIGIEYMYAFIGRVNDRASVILRTDNCEQAEKILFEKGIELIKGSDFDA